MDAITQARPQLVPGLNSLLGLPLRRATTGGEETLEELCHRISRGGPGRFRIVVAADGTTVAVTGEVTS